MYGKQNDYYLSMKTTGDEVDQGFPEVRQQVRDCKLNLPPKAIWQTHYSQPTTTWTFSIQLTIASQFPPRQFDEHSTVSTDDITDFDDQDRNCIATQRVNLESECRTWYGPADVSNWNRQQPVTKSWIWGLASQHVQDMAIIPSPFDEASMMPLPLWRNFTWKQRVPPRPPPQCICSEASLLGGDGTHSFQSLHNWCSPRHQRPHRSRTFP